MKIHICSVGVVSQRNGEIASSVLQPVHPELITIFVLEQSGIHGLTQEDTHPLFFSMKQVAPLKRGWCITKPLDEGCLKKPCLQFIVWIIHYDFYTHLWLPGLGG